MRYTVAGLHKALGKLIANGHGRRIVAVNKESFSHSCEDDGVTILELSGMGIQRIHHSDDDGGTKINKDGTESMSAMLVLVGGLGANDKGELVNSSR